MSDETKKSGEGCCSTEGKGSGSGCGCCGGMKKLVFGLLLGALIFAAGMMFAKSNCHQGMGGMKMCPITNQPMAK